MKYWAAATLAAAAWAAAIGCDAASPAEQAVDLQKQRFEAERAWAETLGRLTSYEQSDLDNRLALCTQQVEMLRAELNHARETLAAAKVRRTTELTAVDSPRGDAATTDGDAEWPERIAAASAKLSKSELECTAAEKRLFRATGDQAELRRMIASRQALTRTAADQERKLRELDKKLGK